MRPTFERIFGDTPQEAVGLQMLDREHPEDRQATEQQAQRVIGASPQLQFESRHVHKDGAVAHILWTAQWQPERRLRLAVAQQTLTAFAQPFDLNGLALSVQPSIDMAAFPEHGTHESMLLSQADAAMYQAKRNGGNQFIVRPRGAAARQGLSGSA